MRRMRILWSSATMTMACVAASSAEPQATAAEVVESFHTALAGHDEASVVALLSPEVLIFESGSAELSRDEYAGHHLGADMEFAAATVRSVSDQRSGEDGEIAWVLTRFTTTGTFRDQEIDTQGVETMLLRRTKDGWKILHIHWSARTR